MPMLAVIPPHELIHPGFRKFYSAVTVFNGCWTSRVLRRRRRRFRKDSRHRLVTRQSGYALRRGPRPKGGRPALLGSTRGGSGATRPRTSITILTGTIIHGLLGTAGGRTWIRTASFGYLHHHHFIATVTDARDSDVRLPCRFTLVKLEFLQSGAIDAPLIRLYGTDLEPLSGFYREIERLSRREGECVRVHALAGIDPVANCQLTLESVQKRPRSLVMQRGNRAAFFAQATCEDWVTVHELLEPLLQHGDLGFQWLLGGDARGLIAASAVGFLVSTYADGRW